MLIILYSTRHHLDPVIFNFFMEALSLFVCFHLTNVFIEALSLIVCFHLPNVFMEALSLIACFHLPT